MKLAERIRGGVEALTSRIPDLDDAKALADRAPGIAVTTAIKGAALGLSGVGLVTRTAGKVSGIATGVGRTGLAIGSALLGRSDEAEDAGSDAAKAGGSGDTDDGPTTDPWTGESLRPVDDIRDAVVLTEEDAAEVDELPGGETLTHADLPLDDYDHLTLGELRSRIRKLGLGELMQLREYEHAHANRLPVLKAFDMRLGALSKRSATTADAEAPTP